MRFQREKGEDMSTKVFVNLPVTNLDRSIRFFEAIGFKKNPHFTDDTAACIVISEYIYTMLLTHPKFRQFTGKEIADASRTTEVLTALTVETRESVDGLLAKALASGATEPRPAQDLGFMYQRSFDDPDGHIWEIFWMDPKAIPAG